MSEESTSVERQREIIETWASANDHQIIGWAEDLDVSGSVDPFDAPALGPWFHEGKRDEWDILCAWKLDRLSRQAIPMNKLFGWIMDHGKTLVCVNDNIDLDTWVGRMVANVIAGVAEGELEAIRERTRESQKKLRQSGRWGGGKIFYGYRAEPLDGGGFELVPDEHASAVVREIVDKVLAGQSTESIARELNERGELAPLDYQRHRAGKPTEGGKWSNAHLRQQLRSKAMLGHATHAGNTVRDEAGRPVLKSKTPLVSQETFDRLQTVLEARSFKVGARSAGASPLLGVAFCGVKLHRPGCDNVPWCGPICDCDVCGKPMHIRQHRRTGKLYRYYQCVGGGDGNVKTHADANIIKADELEELCESTFLDSYGHERLKERVFIPAETHQLELDEAVRAVQEITPLLGAASSETMRKLYTGQLEALDRRIAELEKLPTSTARWEWREQPETYAEVWDAADTEQRRQLLIKRKVRAEVAVPKGARRYRSSAQAMIHLFALDVDLDLMESRAAEERRKYGVPD
ncbi:recombinase family protein [Mycolicibacterium sp.]|uniref:recombinase family protein n=1 Tax=Mycolicibacterium sp. TaxID=2320850 RepID=UPI0035609005